MLLGDQQSADSAFQSIARLHVNIADQHNACLTFPKVRRLDCIKLARATRRPHSVSTALATIPVSPRSHTRFGLGAPSLAVAIDC